MIHAKDGTEVRDNLDFVGIDEPLGKSGFCVLRLA